MARLGIQANELADKVGLTPGAIGNWMTGLNEAKGKNLRKLAEALGCNPLWLSGGESPEITYDTPTLREDSPEPDMEIWCRRAKDAEKKLSQVRAGLRFLLALGSDSMPTGLSSTTRGEVEAIADEIEGLADRNLQEGHRQSPPESAPPPAVSPGSKTPNVP